jgi:hypothetical protein
VRDVHAVGEVGRRHEKGPTLDHQIERLVTHEGTVLDAVDARLDRRPDAVVAMGVGRHRETGPVGLVRDGPQLVVGVLLGAGRAGVRHHPARRADLDQLGAVLDLVADRLAHLRPAVGDALLDGDGQDVGRERLEHRGVEVAAGRRDGVAGGDDPRAVDPAQLDRLHQRHVEQDPARLHEQAEVPHGREPGPQGPPGVGHRPQGLHRGVVLNRDERAVVVGPAHQQADLHVHEAGQQRQVAQVDDDRLVGRGRGRHLDDPLALDQQAPGLDQFAEATRLRDEGADVHAVTVDVRDTGARAYVFTDDHSTGDVEARLRAILAARADVLG